MDKKPTVLRDKEERKKELTISALKVFCQKGYDNTTVDDIVKKAKCSHGLFYHYFKSKKEIFDEVMRLKHDHDDNTLKERVEKESSYREKLRIIINSMFSNMVKDENFPYHYFMFVSRCFAFKEKGKPLPPKDPNKKPFIAIMENLFLEGQKSGEFTSDYTPRECANLFLSVIQGATLGYVIAPKEIQTKIKLPNTDLILDVFSKRS